MKKVYLIYAKIPATLWEEKIVFLIGNRYKYKKSDAGNYIGLYAWTADEDILNDFLEMRKDAKDLYVVKKHKYTKEEFEEFRLENIMEQLKYYDIATNSAGGTKMILCTKNEFQESSDDGAENLQQYFVSLIRMDYFPLQKTYQQALDNLGYTVEFDMVHGGMEDEFYSDRFDTLNYNMSWNLTGLGNPIKLNFYSNKFLVFVNLFFEMIMGFHENQILRFV